MGQWRDPRPQRRLLPALARTGQCSRPAVASTATVAKARATAMGWVVARGRGASRSAVTARPGRPSTAPARPARPPSPASGTSTSRGGQRRCGGRTAANPTRLATRAAAVAPTGGRRAGSAVWPGEPPGGRGGQHHGERGRAHHRHRHQQPAGQAGHGRRPRAGRLRALPVPGIAAMPAAGPFITYGARKRPDGVIAR
jgi:hypothetical protein